MAKIKKPSPAKELEESYKRWEYLYENGGSDPCWPDGVNLNLVKNHIIYYKREIEMTMKPEDYPEIYYSELPPEVPKDYMAQADKIREMASQSLALYKKDPKSFLSTHVINYIDFKIYMEGEEFMNHHVIAETCFP